jgi:hypothetical protein
LDSSAVEEQVAGDEEGVGPLALEGCEGPIDLAAGAGPVELDLQPHGASGRFDISYRGLGHRGIGRIDKHGNARGPRHQLAQESRRFAVISLLKTLIPVRLPPAGRGSRPDQA